MNKEQVTFTVVISLMRVFLSMPEFDAVRNARKAEEEVVITQIRGRKYL